MPVMKYLKRYGADNAIHFFFMMQRVLIWNKIATCQALSGTGAFHLAGKIIKYCQTSALPKVYIPDPTWSNHHVVCSSLGFECRSFSYNGLESKNLDIDSYFSTLRIAEPGSVIILHACAHNPTGIDPSPEQWREVGLVIKERALFPLFDAAYWASTRVTTTRMRFQFGSSSMN